MLAAGCWHTMPRTGRVSVAPWRCSCKCDCGCAGCECVRVCASVCLWFGLACAKGRCQFRCGCGSFYCHAHPHAQMAADSIGMGERVSKHLAWKMGDNSWQSNARNLHIWSVWSLGSAPRLLFFGQAAKFSGEFVTSFGSALTRSHTHTYTGALCKNAFCHRNKKRKLVQILNANDTQKETGHMAGGLKRSWRSENGSRQG